MEKNSLSIHFDSSIQFLDDGEFNETIMAQVELFPRDQFESICKELQGWDTTSLKEIESSLTRFLMTRTGKDLGLGTNLVLDHCIGPDGKIDDFKVYIMTNALEWAISVKEFEGMMFEGQEEQPEEGDL